MMEVRVKTRIRSSALQLVFFVGFAVVASFAQSQTTGVKKAPVPMTSAASGRDMFNSYCATCHGKDGKGNGPAASALKIPPANLTQLAKKNNGKFPGDHVATVLRNGSTPAHGSSDMPIWGPLFAQVSGGDPGLVELRIANLVHYIESIQEK
jgi:mono/diheme cytochrome c family protein